MATLVGFVEGEFIANHIPLLKHNAHEFVGHVAKSNPLHALLPNDTPVLAIFKGEDSYISPNWYPTKHQTHRQVPTWNYQVVHLHGRITFSHLLKDKRAVVGKLTKHHEQKFSGEAAWKMSDAPQDYMHLMLENIVALKISVDRLCAKSKLSQNKEKSDFHAVSAAMEHHGKATLLEAMKRWE